MIDYEKLLIKYIDHVGEMEGVDFIPKNGVQVRTSDFTEEEIVALWKATGWDNENGRYYQ